MKKETEKNTEPVDDSYDEKGLLITSTLIALAITLYFVYVNYNTKYTIIPFSFLAILAGLFLELKRVSKSWLNLLIIILVSFLCSGFAFLPMANERSNATFEECLKIWPFLFAFFFVMIAFITYEKKIIPRLSEGITLMQSVAIIYWTLDYGFEKTGSRFIQGILLCGLVFSALSIYNALSYRPLNKTMRFILSIWSSFIILVFSVDNLYAVYTSNQLVDFNSLPHAASVLTVYFLFGVSLIYLAQNAAMVFGFLPDKDRTSYKAQFNNLRRKHIARYSAIQVHKLHSVLAIVFSVIVFGLNYYYKFAPRNILVWAVFVTFPMLLQLGDKKLKVITAKSPVPEPPAENEETTQTRKPVIVNAATARNKFVLNPLQLIMKLLLLASFSFMLLLVEIAVWSAYIKNNDDEAITGAALFLVILGIPTYILAKRLTTDSFNIYVTNGEIELRHISGFKTRRFKIEELKGFSRSHNEAGFGKRKKEEVVLYPLNQKPVEIILVNYRNKSDLVYSLQSIGIKYLGYEYYRWLSPIERDYKFYEEEE